MNKFASDRTMFLYNYKWLFKSHSYNDSLSLLRDMKMSLDSNVSLVVEDKESYLIYEMFKVHENSELQSYHRGVYNLNEGYISTSLQSNREQLNGLVMNVSFALLEIKLRPNESIEMLLDQFFYPESARFYRFSYQLFMHFSEATNLTYNYFIFDEWGVEATPGNWTGLLGNLQKGQSEFNLQFSNVRKDRMKAVDVHHSYKEVKCLFIFQQPRTFGTYKALIVPFNSSVWICLGITVMTLFMIYGFLKKYDKSVDLNSWSSIFIYLAGIVAQQGFMESGGLITTKVVSCSVLILTFLLCLYYNAAVLNGMLSLSPNSINTMDKLLDSGFKIGVLNLPYMHDFDSEESIYGVHNDVTKKMFRKLFASKQIFYGLEEGLEKVKKGRFAFFADDGTTFPLVKKLFSDSEICSTYTIFKKPKIHAGITLKKNSAYKELLSKKFSWMREAGLHARNLDVWYPGLPKCNWRQEAIPIGSEAVLIAFILLFSGIIISVLILITEIYIDPEKANKINLF